MTSNLQTYQSTAGEAIEVASGCVAFNSQERL